jgi:asparagine synthase (glutamine-hydrolysing)
MAALAHRGPDDAGEYLDAATRLMLGHRRLSIIDLSPAGRQPMLSDDGNFVISYNGEIYNYRELRAGLVAAGASFRGDSDTEVLLRLYQSEGVAMLQRLNGIFAFALYDRRAGELLLVRDALGVKPLYYAAGDDGICFASEIKGLLAWTGSGGTLDPASIHRYLTYLWCPGDGTPLAGVRKLEPGEAIRVRGGRIVERWAWYSLPAIRGPGSQAAPADPVAEVRETLRRAVHRQLVADVPVGAFLSGGLDSSAVVAFARERVPDLRCFTIKQTGGVDAGEASDLPYARRVASHLGVRLDVVSIDAGRMASDLEAMVWQLDEPLADPAPLNVLYISRLAREVGIKVLLSGAGGDDLFTGYRRHVAQRFERWWAWLPTSVRQGLDGATRRFDVRSAWGRRLSRLFAEAGASGDRRVVAYFAWARRDDLMALYSPWMLKAVADVDAAQPMLDFLSRAHPARTGLDRMLSLEQRFFLADHNLIYTDKMSMAAGVEVRVPFLDPEMVELASRIPDRMKQRGPVGKWVLKQAMEPYLPREVIHRPKTGFGAPLRRWMRHELRELLGDVLSESSLRRRGLFDPAAVRRLIEDNDAGRRDAAYTLLSLLCVEIWCRRFVDGGASSLAYGAAVKA